MLISIHYDVIFAVTGRRLTETIHFERGFGTITGPNESGKSFMLEMIRWLLFGTSALRGVADEYQKLSGKLEWRLKGKDYTVTRTGGHATLAEAGQDKPIAVGTKPVNVKIANLLGFGLDVFDVACACNQDTVNKLGEMRSAERKRMVDSVIGLGVIDELTKMASDNANQLTRDAEKMKEFIRKPQAPVMPEGYRPSHELDETLAVYRDLLRQKHELNGSLRAVVVEPDMPKAINLPEASELEEMARQQLSRDVQLRGLKEQVRGFQEPRYSEAELDTMELVWDAYEKFSEAQKFIRLNPHPDHTLEELDQIELHQAKHQEWKLGQHLLKQIEDLKKQGTHTCPSCSHEWFVSIDTITKLEQQFEALPADLDQYSEPIKIDVAGERRRAEAWLKVADQYVAAHAVPPAEQPPISRRDIEIERGRLVIAEKAREVQAQILALEAEMKDHPNYEVLLRTRRDHDNRMRLYYRDLTLYEAWLSEARDARQRLVVVEEELAKLEGIEKQHGDALLYEAMVALYEKDLERYTKQMHDVQANEEQAEEWKRARVALTNFRTSVKQHLIPSLNTVASILLQQMSGGQRQVITVDDDFEITVDGQRLHTLSGSGKAIANLALRIGLGRVLTNNILSIFIGDEIDGSMDANRAENTSQTLQSLKQSISQILLITHKYPSADYYISLGNSNEIQLT